MSDARVMIDRDEIVERGQANQAAQQSSNELAAILAFSQQVSASLNLDRVVQATLDGLVDATAADLALLLLRDADTPLQSSGRRVANHEMAGNSSPEHHVARDLCELAIGERNAIYITNIRSDTRPLLPEGQTVTMQSFVAQPLIIGQTVLGALVLASIRERDFSQHATFLNGFASQVAIAVQNALLHSAAQESEARYRTLYENSPLGIYRTTPQGQIVLANPALVRMLGYTTFDELAARDLESNGFEIGYPRSQYQEAMEKDGQVIGLEVAWKRRDGQIIFVRENARAIWNADGAIQYYDGTVENVTERKLAEEALRKSEELFRSLVEQSFDGIAILDEENRYVEWNGAMERITGIPRDEVLGQFYWDVQPRLIMPERRTPNLQEDLRATLQAKRDDVEPAHASTIFESELQRADGTRRLVQATSFPIRTGAGYSLGIVIQDLTEVLRAEAEARQKTTQMIAIRRLGLELADNLDVDSLLNNIVRRAVDLVNGRLGGIYLYRPERELLELYVATGEPMPMGRSVQRGEDLAGNVWETGELLTISNYTHWDGRAAGSKSSTVGAIAGLPLRWRDEFQGVLIVGLERGQNFSTDAISLLALFASQSAFAIKNAQLFQAEYDQRMFAETLRTASSIVVATLEMETVLDRLLEQLARVVPHDAANIMLIEDDHVRIVRQHGYERFGDSVPSLGQKIPMGSLSGVARMMATRSATLLPDTDADPEWEPIGEQIWINSYAGAPLRVHGEIIGFLNVNSTTPGFFTQLHAERLLAFADQMAIAMANARLYETQQAQFRALQASQAQLIQAEKLSALGRLTASIAHEINNPLQAIQTCLSLLEESLSEGGDIEEMQQDLEIATAEVLRIGNLLKRLRDFYRPAHESIEPTDLYAVLDHVLHLTGKQLQRNKIRVEQERLIEPAIVMGNADHLKQVALNLLLNAVDAIGDGGGVVSARVSRSEILGQDGQTIPAVRFELSDTGRGMSAVTMANIFEPFYTNRPEGTGLGLYICYEIVQAHNGQITIASQPGEGTTVTVLLPRAQDAI